MGRGDNNCRDPCTRKSLLQGSGKRNVFREISTQRDSIRKEAALVYVGRVAGDLQRAVLDYGADVGVRRRLTGETCKKTSDGNGELAAHSFPSCHFESPEIAAVCYHEKSRVPGAQTVRPGLGHMAGEGMVW